MTITIKKKTDDLPKGWIQTNLGNQEFFDLIMGQSPSSETYTIKKTGLPFLQGNADFGVIHPNPKTYCTAPMKVAEKNDVLISVRAPVGEVNIATERYCIGRGLGAIRSKDKHDSKYLYYYLNHYRHDLERISAGSTFKAITKDDLEKFSVTFPPSEEKQKITSILTTVDDAIQRSRQAAAETERLKAGVMQELMTKGIGHTEFREDPDVGMVPKEWEIRSLSELCDTTSGGTPSRSVQEFYNGSIPWLKSGELNDGVITSTEECITEEAIKKSSTKIIPKGTVLIALYGATVGKVGILGIDSAINQAICAIFIKNALNPKYLFNYLLFFRNRLLEIRTGGAQPNISQDIIKSLKLPLPPLSEQQLIVTILSAIDRKLDLQHQRTAHYERLKQGLMNELLTGNRRVQVT